LATEVFLNNNPELVCDPRLVVQMIRSGTAAVPVGFTGLDVFVQEVWPFRVIKRTPPAVSS
jgi:hypothetical protein